MPELSELLGRTFENGLYRARIVEVPADSTHGYVMVESLSHNLRWPVTVTLVKELLKRRTLPEDPSPKERVAAPEHASPSLQARSGMMMHR